MRRIPWILRTVIAAIAAVAIGVTAYNAGYNHGLDQAHNATQIVRTVGPGFGFFPFGFLLFPLFVFVIFRFTGRRRSYGNGHDHTGGSHAADGFDEWHRRQHDDSRGTGAAV